MGLVSVWFGFFTFSVWFGLVFRFQAYETKTELNQIFFKIF